MKNLCGYHREWSPYQGHCGESLPRWPGSWAVGEWWAGACQGLVFWSVVGSIAVWLKACTANMGKFAAMQCTPRCCIEPPTNGLATGGVIFRLWMLARLGYLWCLGLVCGYILSQVELHHISAVSTKRKSERGLWFPVLCIVLDHWFP